ncbi:hypothetical protein BU15DRAFT_67137 [Melanogaster broomeanus]|nr:hypothetical protein BU15DRAFT_67137 [Melanogaster broomeanus]
MQVVVVTAISYDYSITSDRLKEQAMDLDVYGIPPCPLFGPSFYYNRSILCVRMSNDAPMVPNVWIHNMKGTVLFHVYNWSGIFFFATTDLVMLFRIYAMYHRSRTILVILLASYIPSVVINFATTNIYRPHIDVSGIYDSKPNSHLLTSTIPVLFGTTTCTLSFNVSSSLNAYFLIPKVVLSAVLCGFAVVQLVRESLQMHRAIKQWRSNQYLELLVRESVLYFVVYLFAVVAAMVVGAGLLQEFSSLLLYMFAAIAPVVLSPRLIISVREFHSRVVGDHIDTGFGAISRHPISTNETMVFANPVGPTETIRDYRGAEETSEIV